MSPALAVQVVRAQARDLSLDGDDAEGRYEALLLMLERAGVPDFVAALRGAAQRTAVEPAAG